MSNPFDDYGKPEKTTALSVYQPQNKLKKRSMSVRKSRRPKVVDAEYKVIIEKPEATSYKSEAPSYEKDTEKVSEPNKKSKKEPKLGKPLFGTDHPLTSNKSAEQLVKEEKARLKKILKEAEIAERKAKGEKARRAKAWKKKTTYSFNRRSPLARKLRKIF